MIKLKDLLRESEDTKNTAGVLYQYNNKFLLCLSSTSRRWNIPKGHMMVGETPLEGALREFKEETELTLDGIPKLSLKHTKDNGGIMHIFSLTGEVKLEPTLNHEHTDWGYFEKDNLPKPTHVVVEKVIKNA